MGLMKKALAVSTLGASVAAEKVVKSGVEHGWTTPMRESAREAQAEKKQQIEEAKGQVDQTTLWTGTSREAGRNAQIRLYADRIEREKQRSRMSLSGAAQDNEVIPIRSVTSVNIKKHNIMFSDVLVMSAGGTIPFRMAHDAAQGFKHALMPLVLSAGQPQVVVQQAEPQIDVADQIRKLAELRDQGILNFEEFEAKKSDLLSRM
jgi:hypothetical protein